MSDTLPPTAPPPMPPGGYGAPPQPTSNGLAIATLVLGIVGLAMCPPLGLAAIIMGIIVILRTNREPHRYGGQGMAIGGLVCGAVSMVMLPLMLSILLPSLSRARELSKRLVCASNLRAVATSVESYQNDFPGQGMPTFDLLMTRGDITGKEVICPSSGATQVNYLFAPTGAVAPVGNGTPLAWEPLSNHAGEGGNILFADGHVEFVKPPEYEAAIARVRPLSP